MKKLPDKYFTDVFVTHPGRKPSQRLKAYLVMQFLLNNSDKDHPVKTAQIIDYLKDKCHIYAESHSIYQDIKEINIVALMLKEKCTFYKAFDMMAGDCNDDSKLVIYDKSRRMYYVNDNMRIFSKDEIYMLIQCIYTSSFISKSVAQSLISLISNNMSIYQAKAIKNDVFTIDREKTFDRDLMYNVASINSAMFEGYDDDGYHMPEKIAFTYMRYSFNYVNKRVERHQSKTYTVSPYKLVINEGKYYLLAYSNEKMRTFRVDRMKNIVPTGERREGEEAFNENDIRSHIISSVSMYNGEQQEVTIRFVKSLLDTVIDQFGIKGIRYEKTDNQHFTVTTTVDISEQFFGWLLRFGNRAKIQSPTSVVKEFTEYLDVVRKMYRKPADD